MTADSRTNRSNADHDIPPLITFVSGAELLMRLGIVDSITPDGIRYIARTRPSQWPFGEGRPHPYGKASNARTMATEPFLAFFREYPPNGRGPDRAPRRRGE